MLQLLSNILEGDARGKSGLQHGPELLAKELLCILGEVVVAAAVKQAEEGAKAAMVRAEERAAEQAKQAAAEAQTACDELKAKAEARLSAAADLIMERVV